MSARPMNDDEVVNEMNKMVTFIKQEALEKAREIRVKADEEFAIEKAKIVKQESLSIDASFEKKRKGAEVAQKIAQSTQTNKSRLKLLQAREQYLQDLFAAARAQLVTISGDRGRYVQLLEGLILQCLLQQMESEVTVYSRKKDADVAKEASSNAAQKYLDISGREVKVNLQNTLADDGAGGIKITNGSGRITIDNTLDERMRLLEDRMLPEIRADLFGLNENRRFTT